MRGITAERGVGPRDLEGTVQPVLQGNLAQPLGTVNARRQYLLCVMMIL